MSNILRKIKRDGGRRIIRVCDNAHRDNGVDRGNVLQIFSASDFFEFCDEIDIEHQICKCGNNLSVDKTYAEESYGKLIAYGLSCLKCGGKYSAMAHDANTSRVMREIFHSLGYDKDKINEYFHQNAEKEVEA